MKLECLTAEEALRRGRALPWALVRSLGGMSLGAVPETIETEELVEARFFDAHTEVRLFRRDGALQGAALTEEDGDNMLERVYRIENSAYGARLKLASTLEADEDGQTYIAATRICGWEER